MGQNSMSDMHPPWIIIIIICNSVITGTNSRHRITVNICDFFRCVWKISDHVCNGVHNTVPGSADKLHLTVQHNNEGCLHLVLHCYCLLDVCQVQGDLR